MKVLATRAQVKIVSFGVSLMAICVALWFIAPYIQQDPARLVGSGSAEISLARVLLSALLFVVLYSAGAVVLFPSAVLTLAGGYLFGAYFGLLINLVGATAGGVACFHLARKMKSNTFVERVRKKIYSRTRFLPYGLPGPIKVMLLRLTPGVPYSGVNYGMGLTPVSGWHFMLGTFIGLFPKVLLGTLVGAASRSLPGL